MSVASTVFHKGAHFGSRYKKILLESTSTDFTWGGVQSALELERRCGFRLRQVRGADLLLDVYDVMQTALEEEASSCPRPLLPQQRSQRPPLLSWQR